MALTKCDTCSASISESATSCPMCGEPRQTARAMGLFQGLCWVGVLISAVAAEVQLFDTFSSAQSAPQQAAGAAMSVATVVAPYCFARAVRALSSR